MVQRLLDESHGLLGDLVRGLIHRGECGGEEFREGSVIETGDGHILRDLQARLPEYIDRPQGAHVIGADACLRDRRLTVQVRRCAPSPRA